MEKALDVWNWCVRHEGDIILGIVLLVIGKYFAPVSWMGWLGRRVKNKFAESSTSRLRTRISKQQQYRDTVAGYLTSDKALYLATLRSILTILMIMCLGLVTLMSQVLTPLPRNGNIAFIGFMTMLVAIFLCGKALGMASLDTPAKIRNQLAQLDDEIGTMKVKLARRAGAP